MPPLPDTSASAAAEIDPTLGVLLRRRRNLRKKLDKVSRLEEAGAAGKELNEDQIAILEAGPSTRVAAAEVDALIESVSQLLSEASSKRSSQAPPPAPVGPPAGPPPAPATPPSAGTDNAAATENGGSKPLKPAKDAVDVDEAVASALKRVLEVVYFGEMFSGNGFRAAMERQAILSYEEFAEGPDAMPPPPRSILTTEDLDKLCNFADQLSTRPRDRAVSHKQALENCLESAMKLLGRGRFSGEKADEDVEAVAATLEKIYQSQYFTVEPVMRTMQEHAPSPAMPPPAPQPDISFMTESNILPSSSAAPNGVVNNGTVVPPPSMPVLEQPVEMGAQVAMEHMQPTMPSQQTTHAGDKVDAPQINPNPVPFEPKPVHTAPPQSLSSSSSNEGYMGAANKPAAGNTGPWRGGPRRGGGFGGRRGGGGRRRHAQRTRPQV